MPYPRKPSNVLELKGAFKQNPQRRRKAVKPVNQPIGSPPDHLSPEQAGVWAEIARIAPPNVLKQTDHMSLEVFACLMAEFRQGPELFTAARIAQLMQLFGRFGMTPADREKISIDQGEAVSDQFAEFL
jgi:phage terminase small subunit